MKVIVYGLPRTGTNYLEYLIRYNTNCEQSLTVEHSEYVDFVEGPVCGTKHCKPRLNGYDIYIIIIKNSESFITSFCKFYGQWGLKFERSKLLEIYSKALYDYIEFQYANKELVTIVNYESLLGNESALLNYLHSKHGISINKELNIPKKVMSSNGGFTMTEEDFICITQ